MALPRITARDCQRAAIVSLIALIALCLLWETILAPLRPGGSWLMLKVLPLLAPLFGVLRGKRYTYQWASMMILFYFAAVYYAKLTGFKPTVTSGKKAAP